MNYNLNEKKFYLLGCGKTTKALAKLLNISVIYDDNFQKAEHNNSDKSIRCMNSKEILTINVDENSFLIPTPAIPPFNPVIKKFGKNLISEYDLIAQFFKMPFSIWISGTNGKTTTTQMISHLLNNRSIETGGNIGKPLGELDQEKDIWVLETSSFSLHYTNFASPNLYILLPIKDDHLYWHGNFEEYEKSKLKPLFTMKEGEIAIIPKKYDYLKDDENIKAYLITYENQEDLANYFNFDLEKINFKGGFLVDALLSLAVTKILFDEVDYNKINNFTKDFHRQEEVRDSKNRVWINDSKATNIDSTISLLDGIDRNNKIYLILGGDDKGADLNILFKELQKYNLEIFAIGKNSSKLLELSELYALKCTESKVLESAISDISEKLTSSEIGILSPACASFDQFKSYENRGNIFKELVKKI